MSPETVQRRLQQEPDFIALRKYDYSLRKLLERYPDGCPDHVAAQALGLSEDAYRARYTAIVADLRAAMKVEL